MKHKIIAIFLIIIILLYSCSFVFANNITNEEQTEEQTNEQQNLIEKQKEITEQIQNWSMLKTNFQIQC